MENVKRGKLKLKTSSKLKATARHKKHKKKVVQHRESEDEAKRFDKEEVEDAEEHAERDDMTPAQRRHAEHQKKRARLEQEEIAKLASKTYRERIEELNQHLGSLTEHHDVPRVSAAGNG